MSNKRKLPAPPPPVFRYDVAGGEDGPWAWRLRIERGIHDGFESEWEPLPRATTHQEARAGAAVRAAQVMALVQGGTFRPPTSAEENAANQALAPHRLDDPPPTPKRESDSPQPDSTRPDTVQPEPTNDTPKSHGE
jgi:hypothetical protein